MPTRIKKTLTMGGPAAEHDPYLLDAYVDNGTVDTLASHEDPRCFMIGRTGSGKSATLLLLEHSYSDRVVRIAPEDLAMTYITNLNILPTLVDMDVQLEAFLKALWKHIFIVEILRHRYVINTPDQKRNIIAQLIERLKKDPGKVAAVKYLDEFGDKFWCETHERVQQVVDTLESKLSASGKANAGIGSLGASGTAGTERTERHEVQSELAARYQRIVNEVQIPRLNKMMEILRTDILDRQHRMYIVIDDLDKEWVDERFVMLLIRSLFNAVMDMKKVENLKILVALRTNIFLQLNYGETRRGEQEEKVRAFTLNIRWEPEDLRTLLAKRAEVASRSQDIDPPFTLNTMLPKPAKRGHDPVQYILSRTLMRPRDAISFLNECLAEATGHESISMENIHAAEKRYSEGRLNALRDEWRDPYLDIDWVFRQFEHSPARFTRSILTEMLDKVALLIGDDKFRGRSWLEPLCAPIWSSGSESRTWTQNYGDLTRLLYRIGFLGIAKHNEVRAKGHTFKDAKRAEVIYSYDQPNFLIQNREILEPIQFEIHPAFHDALKITHDEIEEY